MTDADLILALRQRGWTDCADAIEAGQKLHETNCQRLRGLAVCTCGSPHHPREQQPGDSEGRGEDGEGLR